MADVFVSTQVGGMNTFTHPAYLDEATYHRGVNLSSRGGVLHTRPRFSRVAEQPVGRAQGTFAFFDRLYTVVSGKVYYAEGTLQTWNLVPGIHFSPYVSEIYATPVYGDYLFMNDGVHMPAIVGPYANRHLSTQNDDPEIPSGTLCVFGQGRIFFFDRYKQILQAGDVYKPGDPESCLKFTEQAFLNESLSIDQPASYGEVRSMNFVKNMQTGTGLGQLVVFYEGGACAYNVYEPRADWLNVQLGQSLFTLSGTGGAAFNAQINNDLFFRTDTGLTTLRDYSTATNQGIRTLPISIPITPLLDRDQVWTLEPGSLAVDDNRVLFTSGLRIDAGGDSYFDSIISMDLASFYSGGDTQMTFDGFWTGPKMTKVFTGTYAGDTVTFITSKGEDNANILWRFNEDLMDDTDKSPRSRWYSRRMFFTNAFQYSRFVSAEIWFEEMRTDVSVKLYFRGESELWQEASSGAFNVPYYDADTCATDVDATHILPQGRAKVRIAVPEDACDPVTKRQIRSATSFQFCLEVTGVAAEPRMRFTAGDPAEGGEDPLCNSVNEEDILLTDAGSGCILYDYDLPFLT